MVYTLLFWGAGYVEICFAKMVKFLTGYFLLVFIFYLQHLVTLLLHLLLFLSTLVLLVRVLSLVLCVNKVVIPYNKYDGREEILRHSIYSCVQCICSEFMKLLG
jgi:hypothetical protein